MRVLLDSHTFLWAITDNKRLSRRAREVFIGTQRELLFSVAGIWELLTKVQIGKLSLPTPASSYLKEQLVMNDIQVLSIRMPHVLRLEQLPLHHRDPFDRMLAAQAILEGLPLVTDDPAFSAFTDVVTIW